MKTLIVLLLQLTFTKFKKGCCKFWKHGIYLKRGWKLKLLMSSTKHFHMESIFSHIPENVFVGFLNETLILEWLFIYQSLLSLLLSDSFPSLLYSYVSPLQIHHRAKFTITFHRHKDFPSWGALGLYVEEAKHKLMPALIICDKVSCGVLYLRANLQFVI